MPKFRFECAACGGSEVAASAPGTPSKPPAGWWEHHGAPFAAALFCSIECVARINLRPPPGVLPGATVSH